MAKLLSIKIDVSKIDKDRLYNGKKGTYLDAVCYLNDEPDQFGNHGFIAQSVTQQEREAGQRGNILGNIKIVLWEQKGAKKSETPTPQTQVEDDGLPF